MIAVRNGAKRIEIDPVSNGKVPTQSSLEIPPKSVVPLMKVVIGVVAILNRKTVDSGHMRGAIKSVVLPVVVDRLIISDPRLDVGNN